jgi:hypothetical protein
MCQVARAADGKERHRDDPGERHTREGAAERRYRARTHMITTLHQVVHQVAAQKASAAGDCVPGEGG